MKLAMLSQSSPDLEVELELSADRRAETVKELAEVRTVKIVLHVTWIEVVRDVENDDTGAHLLV